MNIDTYMLSLRDAYKDRDGERFDKILESRERVLEKGIDEVIGGPEGEVPEQNA